MDTKKNRADYKIQKSKASQLVAWANVVILATSLTLQVSPTRAFAADAAGHNGGHPGHNGGHNGGGHGNGNQNHPTPPPAPNPNPAPNPTHSTTPGPDLNAARAQGRADAMSDGEREGRERGAESGRKDGEREGYREGFDRCSREEAKRAHDSGFQQGYSAGSVQGAQEGQTNGAQDGTNRGQNDGQADGYRRADQDSNAAATPAGQAKGIQEANDSDATQRGARDGAIAGDREALNQAIQKDYAQGRKDYRQARYNEPTQSHDQIEQKAPPVNTASLADFMSGKKFAKIGNDNRLSIMAEARPDHGDAGPDFRYLHLNKNYPTPQENQAYAEGAREGYTTGFHSGFSSSYEQARRRAAEESSRRGCEEARHRDYSANFNQGVQEGHDQGYKAAYDPSFQQASTAAYNQVFPTASAQAYQANYQDLYNKHFEDARSAAYASRVNDLYNAAYSKAETDKYNEMYPTYAKQQYAKGEADEAKDFQARPVRLISVEPTETIVNGVFEPGEALRLHLQLRNFAKSGIAAQDIGIQIKANDASQSVITIPGEYLRGNLKAKSLTDVREALEFRMNESAVDQSAGFTVELTYKGKVIDSKSFDVRPEFMTQIQLAENPALKEGLPTPIRVRVTNSSNKDAQGVIVQLKTDPDKVEVDQPVLSVGTIPAGQSKIVEFTAIGRDIGNSPTIPLAFVATEGGSVSGRRIGVLDLTQEVPVINDYRVNLTTQADGLRNAGLTRVAYTIKNISRRLMFNSLQLKVSFLNTQDPSNFVVIGPNPQYLMPLDRGESTSFLIPVLVKSANRGGTLQIEVQEAGKTVVIHRVDFSKSQSMN